MRLIFIVSFLICISACNTSCSTGNSSNNNTDTGDTDTDSGTGTDTGDTDTDSGTDTDTGDTDTDSGTDTDTTDPYKGMSKEKKKVYKELDEYDPKTSVDPFTFFTEFQKNILNINYLEQYIKDNEQSVKEKFIGPLRFDNTADILQYNIYPDTIKEKYKSKPQDASTIANMQSGPYLAIWDEFVEALCKKDNNNVKLLLENNIIKNAAENEKISYGIKALVKLINNAKKQEDKDFIIAELLKTDLLLRYDDLLSATIKISDNKHKKDVYEYLIKKGYLKKLIASNKLEYLNEIAQAIGEDDLDKFLFDYIRANSKDIINITKTIDYEILTSFDKLNDNLINKKSITSLLNRFMSSKFKSIIEEFLKKEETLKASTAQMFKSVFKIIYFTDNNKQAIDNYLNTLDEDSKNKILQITK